MVCATRGVAVTAGVRSVHVERLLDHLLGAEEPLHALEPGASHPLAALRILQQLRDRRRERARDRAAAPAVPSRRATTTSGMPPVSLATVAFDNAIASSSDVPSPSKSELMTNRSKLLMNDRMSARNPGSSDVLVEVQLLDLPLERRPEVSFAENHESRVGHFAHDERRRVDQVLVTLFLRQRRHRADDGRLRRQPELGVDVRRRLRLHAVRGRCLRRR